MKKTLLLSIAMLLGFVSVVAAHGPTRQKVTITKDIAASPEKVWSIIGNFQDMSWHPAVVKTEGEGDNQPGAIRTLTLGSGGKIFEKLEKYDADKQSMFYRIEQVDVSVLPVTNYSSWLSVKATDAGSSVTWKGAFYRGYPNNDPPAELNDEASVNAITGVYQGGLDNVQKLAEQP